ncbi:MAG: hypothetical protein JWM02_3277 [Frankiales bacterium]|nr:hypothetical protein [Frankiales bacterium]
MALFLLLRSADASVMEVRVTRGIEDRLQAAVWAFHAAVQRRDGVESRLRRGEIDSDLYDRTLTAAEAVIQARIALYRLLISEGWTPPPEVARDIAYDDNMLHQLAEHLD